MKWVRCPKCRTVNDVDRYAMCDGCDASLSGLPSLDPSRPAPAVRVQAERDSKVGRNVLLTVGILSALAMIGLMVSPTMDAGCVFMVTGFPLLVFFLWFAMARKIHASSSNVVVKGILYVLSVGAASFGALIILSIVCSGSRVQIKS